VISVATIVWLAVAAAWCVLLPVALLIWWRRTRRARVLPFFVGALVFIVFALGLENLLHQVCVYGDNPVSRAINGNVWLYMLYGGLAAGVFEETGRYVAFRWIIGKKKYPGRDTAVTYGIGHGGIESILLLGVNMALFTVLAALLRTGNHEAALSLAKGDAAALAQLVGQLGQFTPGYCILNMLERAGAVILHIALSVWVFLAARDKTQRSWFPFAIVLHAIADMPAALYQKGLLPLGIVELWLWVVALYALRSARKCYLEAMDP